jgi:hypothetical protein
MHEEHLKNKVIFDLTKLSRILQMRHKKLSDINWNRIKPFDLLSLNEKDFHNCIVSKDDEKRSYKKEEIIELFGAIKKTKEYKDSRSLELVLGNANINGGKKDRFNDVNFVNRGKIGWLMGDGFVNAGGQMLYNASNMFNQIESVSAGFERAAYEIPRHIDEIKNTASVTSRTIEQLLKVVNAILQKIGHIFNSDRESDKVIVKQKKIMIPMSIISAIIIVIFLKQLLHYFLFSIDLEKNNTEITAGCIKEIQFINPTECVIHHTLNDLLNKPCYKQIKRKVIDGLRKLHQSYLFDDLISRKNFLIMLCACLNPFLIYFSYEILYFFQYCLLSLIYFEEKIFNYNNTGSSIEEPVLGNKHTEVDKNLLENRFELSSVVDDSKFQPRQQIPISGIDNCEDEKLSEVAERPKRYSGGGKKLPHAFRYCVYTIPGLFILVILCRNDIWQGINHTAKYILESYLVIFFKERLKDLKGKL